TEIETQTEIVNQESKDLNVCQENLSNIDKEAEKLIESEGSVYKETFKKFYYKKYKKKETIDGTEPIKSKASNFRIKSGLSSTSMKTLDHFDRNLIDFNEATDHIDKMDAGFLSYIASSSIDLNDIDEAIENCPSNYNQNLFKRLEEMKEQRSEYESLIKNKQEALEKCFRTIEALSIKLKNKEMIVNDLEKSLEKQEQKKLQKLYQQDILMILSHNEWSTY
ncbi:MAG: hypothetical protein MHPSP_002989, partial [Paramarteilia canceri]